MALTSSIKYCTNRDLQDVFPDLAQYDLKRRLYNWQTVTLDGNDYYIQWNSGLVTQLFVDGKSQQSGNQTVGTTAATAINENPFAVGDTTLTVDSGSALTDATYIKIDDEILGITNISTNNVTVTRGELGTTAAAHADDTSIYKHFQPAADGDNLYDSDNDFTIVKYATNLNDSVVEAGDDWATIKDRFIKQASRLVESSLDTRISKEIWLDREGNYPDIIVRLTALQTIILLISSRDPNNEFLQAFKEEKNEIINGINGGTIALPNMRTRDSSQGFIRKVAVNSSSDLFPIELRGEYQGRGYELLKVFIDTSEAGAIGTAKMTVHGKSDTSLKSSTDVLVDSETITGDFQTLGIGSLYIRWSGDDVATATCTAADEYEIEVWGNSLGASTSSNFGSVSLTRTR